MKNEPIKIKKTKRSFNKRIRKIIKNEIIKKECEKEDVLEKI